METFSALLAFCAGNSPVTGHKGQWREALMFSLICARMNAWVNNCGAGDLRCHRAHYDVIVMMYVDTVFGQIVYSMFLLSRVVYGKIYHITILRMVWWFDIKLQIRICTSNINPYCALTGKQGVSFLNILRKRACCEDPDSKVHGANMGPIWGRQDPGGPHVGPMNFAIWGGSIVAH